MTQTRTLADWIALLMLAFIAWSVSACSARDPEQAGTPRPRRIPINVNVAVSGFATRATLLGAQNALQRWAHARAYEKLAIGETLLPFLLSEEHCDPRDCKGYEWHEGTSDLSRVAGRAKWGIEQVLGVSLPNVLPTSSPEDLKKLHAEASNLVDAFRNGIMALASDMASSPARLAQLKDAYRAKIVPGYSDNADDSAMAMEELLGEWPPVGRRLMDLVFIIGAEPESGEDYAKGAVSYRFSTGIAGSHYLVLVRDGIIVSVRKRSMG